MLDKEKLDKLEKLPKETDVHELLNELLPNMGYGNVQITHENGNVPEYGKDLICSQEDDIEGTLEWTAFVVKKGNLTGTSQMNAEIKAQTQECFDYPYESLKHGKVKISKVKIVTNGKINSGAKQKFYKDEFYSNPNIAFWENTDLIKHVDKFYLKYWLKGSRNYKNYIELFQNRNKHDDFTKTLGLTGTKIKKIVAKHDQTEIN